MPSLNEAMQNRVQYAPGGGHWPPEYYNNRPGYGSTAAAGGPPYAPGNYGPYEYQGSSLPPAAEGVAPGPAYSDLPLSTGSPQHPFGNMSASNQIVPGGIDISGADDPIPMMPPVRVHGQPVAGQGRPRPGFDRPGGGYPVPGDTGAGDWANNAGSSYLGFYPQNITGQAGVAGQGGSYFNQSGNAGLSVPGGIGFNPGAAGQNDFGIYGQQGRNVGVMDKGLYDKLMFGSGFAGLEQLMSPKTPLDSSYGTYLANQALGQAPLASQMAKMGMGQGLSKGDMGIGVGAQHIGMRPSLQ